MYTSAFIRILQFLLMACESFCNHINTYTEQTKQVFQKFCRKIELKDEFIGCHNTLKTTHNFFIAFVSMNCLKTSLYI